MVMHRLSAISTTVALLSHGRSLTSAEESSPSTCWDNPEYRSERLGLTCSQHERLDCGRLKAVGFRDDEVEDLLRQCPQSCRVPRCNGEATISTEETVQTNSQPIPQSAAATLVRPMEKRINLRGLQDKGIEDACFEGWDPTCQDDPDYLSFLDLPCAMYGDVDCEMFGTIGFTEQELSALIISCPCSCGIECGLWTAVPTTSPTFAPTQSFAPSRSPKPSGAPSPEPSPQPSAYPSLRPSMSLSPSAHPSGAPSALPTQNPSHYPTQSPQPSISLIPSGLPSLVPSPEPSTYPSLRPSISLSPSARPSAAPSSIHSSQPSSQPSETPSMQPSSSLAPSSYPSLRPSISTSPSAHPSVTPSSIHSSKPSLQPSEEPSMQPSSSYEPTAYPSLRPSMSLSPSAQPSSTPTLSHSLQPSSHPSQNPTMISSSEPSAAHSSAPSTVPSDQPSVQPSVSLQPTASPTSQPSLAPTNQPTATRTEHPSTAPTNEPTAAPTENPSTAPTSQPTPAPTEDPSTAPTSQPTLAPTEDPSTAPTSQPTPAPTEDHSTAPTSQSTPSPSTTPTKQPSPDVSVEPSMAVDADPRINPVEEESPLTSDGAQAQAPDENQEEGGIFGLVIADWKMLVIIVAAGCAGLAIMVSALILRRGGTRRNAGDDDSVSILSMDMFGLPQVSREPRALRRKKEAPKKKTRYFKRRQKDEESAVMSEQMFVEVVETPFVEAGVKKHSASTTEEGNGREMPTVEVQSSQSEDYDVGGNNLDDTDHMSRESSKASAPLMEDVTRMLQRGPVNELMRSISEQKSQSGGERGHKKSTSQSSGRHHASPGRQLALMSSISEGQNEEESLPDRRHHRRGVSKAGSKAGSRAGNSIRSPPRQKLSIRSSPRQNLPVGAISFSKSNTPHAKSPTSPITSKRASPRPWNGSRLSQQKPPPNSPSTPIRQRQMGRFGRALSPPKMNDSYSGSEDGQSYQGQMNFSPRTHLARLRPRSPSPKRSRRQDLHVDTNNKDDVASRSFSRSYSNSGSYSGDDDTIRSEKGLFGIRWSNW